MFFQIKKKTMQLNSKGIILIAAVLVASGFGIKKMFFSSCCAATTETTSGCTPSNCRGAQTKFGEAKVISELRINLIELKADLEKSKPITFEPRSYDIHDIIGDNDDESLEKIVAEIKIVENEFVDKLNYKVNTLELPDNKAKKIQYLTQRIESLRSALQEAFKEIAVH